jgi:hypothetical protein
MYQVGQVIFVVAQRKVIPVQIAEQLIRRTIDGESVEYRVIIDTGAKRLFDLSEIGSLHFESLQSVRDHMMDSATRAVNDLLQQAHEDASKRFGVFETNSATETPEDLRQSA